MLRSPLSAHNAAIARLIMPGRRTQPIRCSRTQHFGQAITPVAVSYATGKRMREFSTAHIQKYGAPPLSSRDKVTPKQKEEQETLSYLYRAMTSKNCRVEKVSDTVDAFIIDSEPGLLGEWDLGYNILFIRSFYPVLLSKIRAHTPSTVLLIGSPGIGKTFFQYYYVARILRPDIFGSLPVDANGTSLISKVLLKQKGSSEVEALSLQSLQAEKVAAEKSPGLTGSSKDSETVTFIEVDRTEVHAATSLVLQSMSSSLATVPTGTNYSELLASSSGEVVEFYLPEWELKELQAVGTYLLDNNYVPAKLRRYYTLDCIELMHQLYGGKFRHVLSAEALTSPEGDHNLSHALLTTDGNTLLEDCRLDNPNISNLLLRYDVNPDFRSYNGVDLLNEFVVYQYIYKRDILGMVDLSVQRGALIRNDKGGGYLESIAPLLFHNVVAELLTSPRGVTWAQRASSCEPWEWLKFTLRLRENHTGDCLLDVTDYRTMECGVLYESFDTAFPRLNFLFRIKEDGVRETVTGIFITRKKGTHLLTAENIVDIMKALRIEDPTMLRLVICPSPTLCEETDLVLEEDLKDPAPGLHVWRLPNTYDPCL